MNDLHVAAAAVAAEVEAATLESSVYYCFAVACLRLPDQSLALYVHELCVCMYVCFLYSFLRSVRSVD